MMVYFNSNFDFLLVKFGHCNICSIFDKGIIIFQEKWDINCGSMTTKKGRAWNGRGEIADAFIYVGF